MRCIPVLLVLGGMPALAHAQLPTQAGQDAYAAIAEVVRLLDADKSTDWSKVNLEVLRQHLIDMNEVTLHAAVAQTPIPGGLQMDVTGEGRTRDAIRRMIAAHGPTLDALPAYRASVEQLPDGMRLTVLAKSASDAAAVTRIRGLGFIGLLTVGAHHQMHHLALARGDAMAHQHQ